MKTAGFIWRALKRMNYGQMLALGRKISGRSGKSLVSVLIDMGKSAVKYQAAPFDYFNFRFEQLNHEERASFVTRGLNATYNTRLNSEDGRRIFADKGKIYEILGPLLGREFLILTKENADVFTAFCAGKTSIMVKPIDGNSGHDVERITLDENTDFGSLHARLLKTQQILVEQYIVQSEHMNQICRASVNTLRVVTLRDPSGKSHAAATVLRMGGGKSPLDNFHAMGLAAVVDADGIIRRPAINKDNETFEIHPASGTSIIGFKIEAFDAAVEMAMSASELVPYMGYLGWDMAFSDKGPVIIEANMYPSYDLIQTAMIADGSTRGIRERYESIAFEGNDQPR